MNNVRGTKNTPEHGLNLLLHRPFLRNIFELGVFSVAFYLAYRYGMSFSEASASPFWFPDSVLLSALLITQPRRWWLFILAALPIRLFSEVAHGIPLWFLLATFVIDSAKGLLAAVLLRRFIANPIRLGTGREFVTFCLLAVLLVPAVFAFAGAAVRYLQGDNYWIAWERWFLGNALAHLVVTPAIFYWILGAPWNFRGLSMNRCVEGALLAIGLILAAIVAFETGPNPNKFVEPRFYLPVPFLIWAAIRFGMLGTSGAIAVVAFIAVDAALEGRGPFFGQSPVETGLALQQSLLLRATPLYLVAVLIEERKGIENSLRESEARFRGMANSAPVLIWMSGPDKLCEFFNLGWLKFTGRTLEQEFGNGWAEGVHPEDMPRCLDIYHSSFDARQPFEMEYRLRRHDGVYRWILDMGVPRYAPNRDFLGYIGSAIDITDRKAVEQKSSDILHRLGERVKELTALHQAARILQDERQTTSEWLQQFVVLLPPAWQHPEITAGRIRLGELEFASPGFKQTLWMQRAEFAVADGLKAAIEVVYLEERLPEQEGPFLAEERNLIDSLAELLRSALERRHAAQTLRESEGALRASYTQVQDLAGKLITAQEVERSRIARDLHDDVNQQIAGLSIALSNVKRRLRNGVDPSVEDEIARLQQRTNHVATVIRQLSHDLHPGVLQHAGLVAALKGHCGEFSCQHGIDVTFSPVESVEGVPSDIALCLYRVAQEALRNIALHADAQAVKVSLNASTSAIELTIADDGRGFHADEVRRGRGLGLISLDERVRLLGGELQINPAQRRGTELRAWIPLGRHENETTDESIACR
jgi:PAS domain S-box-containing protein